MTVVDLLSLNPVPTCIQVWKPSVSVVCKHTICILVSSLVLFKCCIFSHTLPQRMVLCKTLNVLLDFLHPWLTFFRQNMIRTTIRIARRIPQMMQSVINKASFVFSFIINSSEYLYLEKLKYLKMDWKWNFHPKYLRSLEHWLHSGYWLFYPKVLSKIKFLSQPEPSVS